MKSFFKNNIKIIIAVIITMIVTGSVTGVVAYNYKAKDISYTPKDTSWDVNNVESAINDLKKIKDNVVVEQNQKIDGEVTKTYTADKEELFVVCIPQTGYVFHTNSIETTGTILKDTETLTNTSYGSEVGNTWYTQLRTVVIKLKKNETVSLASSGGGYGSGQYSITHIY